MARATKMTVEIKGRIAKPAMRAIVDAVVERLKDGLPGELGKMIENVERDSLDQLALAAVADRCEEMALPHTAASFRRLRMQTGDVLLVRAGGVLSEEGKYRMTQEMGDLADWLRGQGIVVRVVLVPMDFDFRLLRINPEPEGKV